jgi:hypothetical protein
LWIVKDGTVRLSTRRRPASASRSAFFGFRFPAEVITVFVEACCRSSCDRMPGIRYNGIAYVMKPR